jgi:hypothetical protein
LGAFRLICAKYRACPISFRTPSGNRHKSSFDEAIHLRGFGVGFGGVPSMGNIPFLGYKVKEKPKIIRKNRKKSADYWDYTAGNGQTSTCMTCIVNQVLQPAFPAAGPFQLAGRGVQVRVGLAWKSI